MTNTINALQSFLTQEFETCNLINVQGETIVFECTEAFEDVTTIVSCNPFTNSSDEEGYHIDGTRNNHTFSITTVFTSEL